MLFWGWLRFRLELSAPRPVPCKLKPPGAVRFPIFRQFPVAPVGLRLPAPRHGMEALPEFRRTGAIGKGPGAGGRSSQIYGHLAHTSEMLAAMKRSRHRAQGTIAVTEILLAENFRLAGTWAGCASYCLRRGYCESDEIVERKSDC